MFAASRAKFGICNKIIKVRLRDKRNPVTCSACKNKSHLPMLPGILVDILNLIYCYLMLYLIFAGSYLKLLVITIIILGLDYLVIWICPLKKTTTKKNITH